MAREQPLEEDILNGRSKHQPLKTLEIELQSKEREGEE